MLYAVTKNLRIVDKYPVEYQLIDAETKLCEINKDRFSETISTEKLSPLTLQLAFKGLIISTIDFGVQHHYHHRLGIPPTTFKRVLVSNSKKDEVSRIKI